LTGTTDPSGWQGQPSLEADLAAWGKVIFIETLGRRSGRPRRAAVGFIDQDDGTLHVAAADDGVHWALNLEADPRCIVERDGQRVACRATRLDEDAERATAAALILKYGTPAERLGGGPAFRLAPEVRGPAPRDVP
jgi:deazaflavin-dependent oxidoreductase (nitroreductase family)